MKLENKLSIPVPAEEAWRVLLDIERIAPCVPGATLTAKDGDSYQGRIKVKLGAIGLTYTGAVEFLSQDADAKVAVLAASGREARGNGTAKARVTCRLVDTGGATDVFVETDLAITGRPAQFGRGALAEVSGALIGRFAANLAEELAASAGSSAPAASAPADSAPASAPAASAPADPAGTRQAVAEQANAEPMDLLDAVGGGLLKRAAPFAAAAAALLLLTAVARGRRRRPNTVEVVVVRCCDHPVDTERITRGH